jgi:hypothetical protein
MSFILNKQISLSLSLSLSLSHTHTHTHLTHYIFSSLSLLGPLVMTWHPLHSQCFFSLSPFHSSSPTLFTLSWLHSFLLILKRLPTHSKAVLSFLSNLIGHNFPSLQYGHKTSWGGFRHAKIPGKEGSYMCVCVDVDHLLLVLSFIVSSVFCFRFLSSFLNCFFRHGSWKFQSTVKDARRKLRKFFKALMVLCYMFYSN